MDIKPSNLIHCDDEDDYIDADQLYKARHYDLQTNLKNMNLQPDLIKPNPIKESIEKTVQLPEIETVQPRHVLTINGGLSQQTAPNNSIKVPQNNSLGISTYMHNDQDVDYASLKWEAPAYDTHTKVEVQRAANNQLHAHTKKSNFHQQIPQTIQIKRQEAPLIETGHTQEQTKFQVFKKPHIQHSTCPQKSDLIINQTHTDNKKDIKMRKHIERKQTFVTSFTIQSNLDSIRINFQSSDTTNIEKEISTDYLNYLEKYFPTNFNKLLPMHNPQCLSSTPRMKSYLTVYFNFIVENYSPLILKFLREEKYQNTTTVKSNTLQKIKGQLFSTFWQGYQLVSKQLKKIKSDDISQNNQMEKLEQVFLTQLLMAEKMKRVRQDVNKLTTTEIQPSAYQQGDMKKKYEMLSSLQWLIGFQHTIAQSENEMKQYDRDGELVQSDKLKRMLVEFCELRDKYSKLCKDRFNETMLHIYKK